MLDFQVLVCVTIPGAQLNFLHPPCFWGGSFVGQGIAAAMVTYPEVSCAQCLSSNL